MTSPEPAITALLADPPLGKLLAVLNGDGEEARVVGGAVRNALLGLPVNEVDIATTCLPTETTRRALAAGFKAVPTGIEHGTVTVVVEGKPFEVTTLREDVETDGRHAVVRFGRSFELDAQRRDFTINALSLDPTGKVADYTGGLADLSQRRLRFIGDPALRIREDYLRILRFFRFHASYAQGPLDAEGFAAAIHLREGLRGLSAERMRAEIMKLLVAPRAPETAAEMAAGSFWPFILGGVARISRFADYTGAALAHPAIDGVLPRLAALAVDTAEDAARLRERLRLSNAEARGLDLIAAALEALHGRLREASVRASLVRSVLRHGRSATLAAIAIEASANGKDCFAALETAVSAVPAFPITGAHLLARGVHPGPQVGQILDWAREGWIEAGCPTDQASLAEIVDAAIATSPG